MTHPLDVLKHHVTGAVERGETKPVECIPESYVSSICTKYGDVENVRRDVIALTEILSRQGNSLLIDVIAEHAGETVNKFKLNNQERCNIMNSLLAEFNEALSERL